MKTATIAEGRPIATPQPAAVAPMAVPSPMRVTPFGISSASRHEGRPKNSCADSTKPIVPKMPSSARFDRKPLSPMPISAPMTIQGAHDLMMSQSTAPWPLCAITLRMEVRMIVASEVDTATCMAVSP